VTAEDSALHARALYLEGACNRKLEREEAMLAARDKALKLYPYSPDTQELCYSVAAYFDLNYRNAKASEAYGLLYKSFPKSWRADRALWKASILAFQSRQYGEAALGFWNYLISHPSPNQAGPALYWLGRCYERLNDRANAKYLYTRAQALANESYYGRRAREAAAALQPASDDKAASISGIDFKEVMRICNGIQYLPVSIPAPGAVAAQVVSRASALAEADLQDFAISELRWGNRRYPQEAGALNYEMSRICASREDHNGSISALRRVFPDYVTRPSDSLPIEVWQRFYPIRHWEIISSRASTNKLDPSLILAVIRQESGFNEKARSRANARGLMQIIPSTGRRLALQARIPKYSVASLYHAETNITLGIRFLSSLAQRYDAAELALAAYNAGSARVDRWLAEFGRDDMALFVEQIPFSETRNYVMQALSNKARYDLMTSPAGTGAQ
jgi:soluble lytic murein transglycosylase